MKLSIPPAKRTRIEMIPLIDIVFLLLVFFIYAMLSMAVHRGLSISLPDSSTATVGKDLPISISIKGDGSVFIDKSPVDMAALTDVLSRMTRGKEDPGVLLFADRGLSYQRLFDVLDKIRTAGISHISLQSAADISP